MIFPVIIRFDSALTRIRQHERKMTIEARKSFQARMPMLLHEFNWKKEVIQSAEPVLVDFWASWCGPCRSMNPTIEALARDFKVCKVNVDTNQKLAAHYKISSIPALLIFKDGKLVARHVGEMPEVSLRAEMERLSRK
jgi:thioredoxin 1